MKLKEGFSAEQSLNLIIENIVNSIHKSTFSVQKELFDNIDGVITYYRLDSSGKVIRDLNNIPNIYNINKE